MVSEFIELRSSSNDMGMNLSLLLISDRPFPLKLVP